MIPVSKPSLSVTDCAAFNATYRDRLHGWTIVRLLPDMQSVAIARFRRRGDAEAHLKALQQMVPAQYVIVFGAQV